ncbi:hypothetical protein HMN09_00116300 [Mycena chlorophos]|uniref:Uncharacterized protein n=1 Tax=Mycena chlorophos TaxID=658473 RepID=A0A8H6WLT7_MYCCL|nr:hypothetical protein HMN09_00116300 [Mycena chlorophos]
MTTWPIFAGVAKSILQSVGSKLGPTDHSPGAIQPPKGYAPRVNLNTISWELEQPTTSGSLFSLPPELRWCIYQLALGQREIWLIWGGGRTMRIQSRHKGRPGPCVALLRTCRQVYLEARPIPLTDNTLHIQSHYLKSILSALGLALTGSRTKSWPVPLIRTLVIDYDVFPPTAFDRAESTMMLIGDDTLALLRNLKHLTVLVIRFHDDARRYNPQEGHDLSFRVEYDPRELVDRSWGRDLCAIPRLQVCRIEFAFCGVVAEIKDKRWDELGREIVRRASARGEAT